MAEDTTLSAINAVGSVAPALGAFGGPVGVGIGTAASLIPEAYKLYVALQQKKEADALAAQTKRPTYKTPGQINEATDLARAGYLAQGIPGQGVAVGNINATGEAAMRNAQQAGGSTAEILAAGGNINQNQNNALNQIASEGAQLHEQRRAGLMAALNNQARYKDQEFDYNEAQPYAQAMKTIGALRQGNLENMYSGLKGVGDAGLYAARFWAPRSNSAPPISPSRFSYAPDAQKGTVGSASQDLGSTDNFSPDVSNSPEWKAGTDPLLYSYLVKNRLYNPSTQ